MEPNASMRDTRAGSDSLGPIDRALHRSTWVLAHDPGQLAAQVLGRLSDEDDPGVRSLCASAVPGRATVWLRPLTASLTGRGSAEQLSIPAVGCSGGAIGLHTGRRVVALTSASGVELWDIERSDRIGEVPPDSEANRAMLASGLSLVEMAACAGVGDDLLVLTVQARADAGHMLLAWQPDSSEPQWQWRPPTDTEDDEYAPIEALAVGGDAADPLVAAAVWQRGESCYRIYLLRPNDGAICRVLEIGRTGADHLALGSDGSRTVLAASRSDRVTVWGCRAGEVMADFAVVGAGPVALGRAGDRWLLAAGVESGGRQATVSVWDVATGGQVADLPVSGVQEGAAQLRSSVRDLAFVEGVGDGGVLVVGRSDLVSRQGDAQLWEVGSSPRLLSAIPLFGSRAALAVDERSGPAVLATVTGETARLWDVERVLREGIAPSAHAVEVTSVASGPLIASGDRGGVVCTWSEGGRPVGRMDLQASVRGLAWCQVDGEDVLAVALESEIVLVEASTWGEIRRLGVAGTVAENEFGMNGRPARLVAVESRGRWCLAVEAVSLVMPDELDPYDPDRELGQPVNVHHVQAFDAGSGQLLWRLERHRSPMAWSVGGASTVAMGWGELHVSIVDPVAGDVVGGGHQESRPSWHIGGAAVEPGVLRGALVDDGAHLARIHASLMALVGDPGSRWVAAASGRELNIWDGPRGTVLATFTADDDVTCFSVGRDGRRLAVGDGSGAVHHLEISPGGGVRR